MNQSLKKAFGHISEGNRGSVTKHGKRWKRKSRQTRADQTKTRLQKQQKTAKKELRAAKLSYFEIFADEAEKVTSKGDLKTLYATTRILSGRQHKQACKKQKKEAAYNGQKPTSEVEEAFSKRS